MTEDTSPTGDDLVPTVNDPGGSPANRKATLTNVFKSMLGALKGTLTDGYWCKYTASGTLLDCNVNPASYQPYDVQLDTLAAGGAVNTLYGINGAGAYGYYANHSHDNSASIVFDSVDPTKMITLDPVGMTTGKTATIKPICTDNCTVQTPSLGPGTFEALVITQSTITKTEYLPIRYAEDDDSVTAPATTAEIGTTTQVARSFAEDADNGVVFWWHLPLDYSAGIKFRVYFATDTNGNENETAVFNLSGCAMANSGALACAEGTGQESLLQITTDEDTGELLVSGWSAAITIGGSPAAGQMAKLLLIRDVTGGTAEDDMAGHALVSAIEIKYQAKINASGDY